jgi:hypothetical protein
MDRSSIPTHVSYGRGTRWASEHGTGDPCDGPMILFDAVVAIFALADFYRRPRCRVVTLEGGFMGLTPVNRARLRDPVPADRLLEKSSGGLFVSAFREQKVNGLPRLIAA